MKKTAPLKPKARPSAPQPVPPIAVSLKLAGQDHFARTDSVLRTLRSLARLVEPHKIKTMAVIEISFGGKKAIRILKIPKMRMLLANDINRQIVAKIINQSLGIPLTK